MNCVTRKRYCYILLILFVSYFGITYIYGLSLFGYGLYLDKMANYFSNKDRLRERAYLIRLQEHFSGTSYANRRLALSYYDTNDYNIAAKYFENALAIKSDLQSNKLLCYSYFYLGKENESFSCAMNLISTFPFESLGYNLVGISYYNRDHLVAALYYFEKGFKISKDCDTLAFVIDIENELYYFSEVDQYCHITQCVNDQTIPYKAKIDVRNICDIWETGE